MEVYADALIMCPQKGPKLVLDLENFARRQKIVIGSGSNRGQRAYIKIMVVILNHANTVITYHGIMHRAAEVIIDLTSMCFVDKNCVSCASTDDRLQEPCS